MEYIARPWPSGHRGHMMLTEIARLVGLTDAMQVADCLLDLWKDKNLKCGHRRGVLPMGVGEKSIDAVSRQPGLAAAMKHVGLLKVRDDGRLHWDGSDRGTQMAETKPICWACDGRGWTAEPVLDAKTGKKRASRITCHECKGWEPGGEPICPLCLGETRITTAHQMQGGGTFNVEHPCPTCASRGRVTFAQSENTIREFSMFEACLFKASFIGAEDKYIVSENDSLIVAHESALELGARCLLTEEQLETPAYEYEWERLMRECGLTGIERLNSALFVGSKPIGFDTLPLDRPPIKQSE